MSAGMLYDVFVVGASDPSPVAQMHLAARLAEQFHAPAAQIAEAIAARNLRAGQSMDEAQARVLAGRLAEMGAQTEFRPAVANRRVPPAGAVPPNQVTPPPQMVGPATIASGPHTIGAPTQVGGGPTMGGGAFAMPGTDVVGRDPFAGNAGRPLPTLAASPFAGGPPTLGGSGTAVSAPPTTLAPLGRGDPFAPPATRAGGADAFALGTTVDAPKLELGRLPVDSNEMPVARRQRELAGSVGATAGHLAADSALSGVEAATDPKSHMVRCPQHGLYYDKRTASSCRKCLEPAAKRAQNLARKADRSVMGIKLMALREDPVRRAFYGLALALLIGLIPSAVHAIQFGRPAVSELRAEQARLSEQVGTQVLLERYRLLDNQVRQTHSANLRNTALIWLAVGGVSLFGWYRLT